MKYELRNRESIKAPMRYSACLESYTEPKPYSEAMQGKNLNKWKDAIAKELKAHERNKTWELSPANKSIIGCKWVFKIKEYPSTNEVQDTSCAKDYSQRKVLIITKYFHR